MLEQFTFYNIFTSAFWGIRVELYIIAEDKNTGLLSWIIIDYDTNTITYDKKNGLSSPNCDNGLITTDFNGNLIVDVRRNDNSRQLVFESDIKKGSMNNLDQRLWIEANLSIGYGKSISENTGDLFSLKFNPLEMEKALKIPSESLNMQINTWFPGLFKDKPSQLVCFPYAQHFISDSPGHASKLKSEEELVKEIESIDFKKINPFSTKSIRTMIVLGSIVSALITLTLLTLLIIK